MARADTCRLCEEGRLWPVLQLTQVPVLRNTLGARGPAARAAPRGDVELAACDACGALTNTAFDEALIRYSPDYENSLHFSPSFRSFAEELCVRLGAAYALQGKTVLEIGAGKGEFLSMLCAVAGARGIGYDPSYVGVTMSGDIRFVRGYYPTTPEQLEGDFVCCRHVLEHVPSPRELTTGLRGAIGPRADVAVYFEVPDGDYMQRSNAVWDVIYEHPWYFTATALRRLFEASGYDIRRIASSYGGQYLSLEAMPAVGASAGSRPPDPGAGRGTALRFGAAVRGTCHYWEERLRSWHADGDRVAVWGIGSKGVTFLNLVPGSDHVIAAVDTNPRKWGRYTAGTGHVVSPPDALVDDPPDVVLVMNPLYEREIQRDLASLGVRAATVPVSGAALVDDPEAA